MLDTVWEICILNKLWCESTTNPVPVLRIAASRGFSELTQNWIRSSHSAPSVKISCKSVLPFSRNLANKETKKETKIQTKKSIENNTPSPIYLRRGNWSDFKASPAPVLWLDCWLRWSVWFGLLCVQTVEYFAWNVRVLKGQADLLRHAQNTCTEDMKQVGSIP